MLLTTLSAPGIINSLQLLTVPAQTASAYAWASATADKSKSQHIVDGDGPLTTQPPHPTPASKSRTNPDLKAQPSLLVVAALGREPRLGRWLALKGIDGAANAARVFLVPSHPKRKPLENTD